MGGHGFTAQASAAILRDVSESMQSERGYAGASTRTRSETRSYACRCGERHPVRLHRAIDAATDGELARAFRRGELNRTACPRCGASDAVQVSVLLHDPDARRLWLVLPDGLRHRELEERAALWRRLADDGAAAPRYVLDVEVVFGTEALPSETRTAIPTTAPAAQPVAEPAPEGDPAPLLLDERRIKTEAPITATRPEAKAHVVPDPHSAAVDRWVAEREGPQALLAEQEVVLCAALPDAEREPFLGGAVELRLQLHRMPSYPLLALVAVAPATEGARPTAVYAPLELGRAAHRAVLERLARGFQVRFELFDEDYRPVASLALAAPLEENAVHLFREAKLALQKLPAKARDFRAAQEAFAAPDYDRLGRVQVDFPTARGRLDSASTLRRALGEVARWTEPAGEAYLIEIRSYSLGAWRALRGEVVRRALEFGLHARRALVERALGEAGVTTPWATVLKRQVRAFLQLLAEGRCDLDAEQTAENWRLLGSECHMAGVEVPAEARSSAQRAITLSAAGRVSTGGAVEGTVQLDAGDLELVDEEPTEDAPSSTSRGARHEDGDTDPGLLSP